MIGRKVFTVTVSQAFTIEAIDRDHAIEALRYYKAGIAYCAPYLPIEDRPVRIIGSLAPKYKAIERGKA